MNNRPTPICCNQEAAWVDNVPGKEYHYCRSCKKEVIGPSSLHEVPKYLVEDTTSSSVAINDDRFCGSQDCNLCRDFELYLKKFDALRFDTGRRV